MKGFVILTCRLRFSKNSHIPDRMEQYILMMRNGQSYLTNPYYGVFIMHQRGDWVNRSPTPFDIRFLYKTLMLFSRSSL